MEPRIALNEWEIARMIDALSWKLDAKKLDEALQHFTEDVKFTLIEEGKTVINVQGVENAKTSIAARMDLYDILFHTNGTRVFDVQMPDQKAYANTTCIARMIRFDPSLTVTEFLEYADELIKVEGEWYISSRTIHVITRKVR